MRKYVLSLFLLLVAAAVVGQKKSIVNLISSQSSTGIKVNGKDIIKVYKGTFRQDYSTLTSDSAYFYIQDNLVDALGHVNINQGDTLNIYSDRLHYDGNTKVAILTDNVRMIDKDATLTTNHLNYNTATRIGTYTDGGKLVNKDNTLLSKNGYYFAKSRDSYFRYNVSLTTPDALVITDTMRYNTGTKISYFYGPTHIYGKKGEKDKDTLYTENGTYNTVNEQAAFGKKNLYTSGTKSLKGDSLFYDKLKGYGRAVKHVTFDDKEQKVTIKGDLGTYFKDGERTIVTQDPYIIMVTQDKDTTKTDSVAKADSLKKEAGKKKGAINMAQLIKKTIPGKIDTAHLVPGNIQMKVDSVANKFTSQQKKDIMVKADSIIRKAPAIVKNGGVKIAATKKAISTAKKGAVVKPGNNEKVPEKVPIKKDTSKMKTDSIYMSADTIETWVAPYKDLKIYQEKQRLAHIRDTSAKPKKPVKESKYLTGKQAGVSIDTSYRQREFFGKPKPVIVKKKPVKPLTKKQLELDSISKKQVADSILMAKKMEISDTTRIRVIIAYHHFKLFKSDLQSKSDSMFYSSSDSTIRSYVNPMMWTQGSQLSGDTIHMQMKHKKLDNMTMFPSAFIVNIEKDDSTHFNQMAGKRMRGYFKDDKLSKMIIDGNAESIYFSRDSAKKEVDGMQRSLSSKITVNFKDNKVTNLGFYTKPENRYAPLDKFKEDEKILKGFIWKPKDRPVSKESIIPSFAKRQETQAKLAAAKSKTGKAASQKKPDGKTVKDSVKNISPGKLPGLKTGKDSTTKIDTSKLQTIKTGKDSVMKSDTGKTPHVIKAGKDTTPIKPAPVKSKASKDSR